jgi:hypothetical protein
MEPTCERGSMAGRKVGSSNFWRPEGMGSRYWRVRPAGTKQGWRWGRQRQCKSAEQAAAISGAALLVQPTGHMALAATNGNQCNPRGQQADRHPRRCPPPHHPHRFPRPPPTLAAGDHFLHQRHKTVGIHLPVAALRRGCDSRRGRGDGGGCAAGGAGAVGGRRGGRVLHRGMDTDRQIT